MTMVVAHAKRQSRDFLNGFNLFVLSSPLFKNISIPFFRNLCFYPRILIPLRGAARDRHGRWKQDAVDVMVFSALWRADENIVADGEGVWS